MDHDDEGFGLVEIMVSMMLLGILFVALAPVLIGAAKVTAKNTTISAASRLAAERLEQARASAATGSCTVLKDTVEHTETVVDPRGIPLQVTGVVGTCTQTAGSEHSQPRLADVTVRVTTTSAGFGDPVVQSASRIWVKFEG